MKKSISIKIILALLFIPKLLSCQYWSYLYPFTPAISSIDKTLFCTNGFNLENGKYLKRFVTYDDQSFQTDALPQLLKSNMYALNALTK